MSADHLLSQLRLEHTYAHVRGECTCRLWYVPTPSAVRWRRRTHGEPKQQHKDAGKWTL